jgi:RNA polymerase sigma-70 factor (ECF subfamily)
MQSIAYRMTGSVAEAEDLVQEAYLRLELARRDGHEPDHLRAWLSTVTTRLAIDHLRSARARRERYVGPWLPEPMLADPEPGADEHAELADSLSQAFLVVLETLSPVERAVFLLRDVFGYEYAEIAGIVGKAEANVRQLASRARRHVAERRPRFDPDPRRREQLFDRFRAACEAGDVAALEAMLADDVTIYADGGGRTVAARRPISGRARVARVMVKLTSSVRRAPGPYDPRRVLVNGQPGRALVLEDGRVADVLAVDVGERGIAAIRIVRNPDKLAHLSAPAPS